MKHFQDVTRTASVRSYLDGLNDSSLVIYSPTSLGNIDDIPQKGTFISTHAIGKDSARIEKLCSGRQINTVVGLGGGTAIDIAKYIASLTDYKFICIPTMLSTNAFATSKSTLIKNGSKVTLDASLADEIILDIPLIEKAGRYNLYGLCDVLSIHTALFDWQLADKAGIEKIDPEIYEKSQNLLIRALRFAVDPTTLGVLNIVSLFSMIGESGHITNLYGSGRPESGSEHIFAKELESRVEIAHGISIAIGITLMSQLQDNYSASIQVALQQIGILSDIANEYDLRNAVLQSIESLIPRKNRYTILNEKLPTTENGEHLIEILYENILGGS